MEQIGVFQNYPGYPLTAPPRGRFDAITAITE
jgi:hypothetical protein